MLMGVTDLNVRVARQSEPGPFLRDVRTASVHKTLRVTPAMESGIADHVWNIIDVVALIPEEKTKKCGSYKKKNSN